MKTNASRLARAGTVAAAMALLAQACAPTRPVPPAPPLPPAVHKPSDVPDLVCPTAAVSATVPASEAPAEMEAPDVQDLGRLAEFVAEPPPVLDSGRIAEFALRGTARPRRFAIWGDSHIAAGPMPRQLAQALRDSGETVALRFLPPTMGRRNVRLPLRAACIGEAWTTTVAYTQPGTVATGPALVSRSAEAGAASYLWLDLRDAERKATVSGVHLVYKPDAGDAVVGISVNDGTEQESRLAGGAATSGVLDLAGDPTIATLKLRVASGRLELLGMILDRVVEPTVTLDVFGLPSSQASGWANADPAALAQSLNGARYDGVILEYGTNEGNDPHFDAAKYAASLTRSLTNLRVVFPAASCVLVGPPDRGVLVPKADPAAHHKRKHRHRKKAPDLLRFARIVRDIARVQSEVGAKFGCAFWNWQDFMGGPGGSYGWVHNVPPLMGADFTHLTAAGYRLTAAALAQSLGWAAPPPGR